MTGNRKDAVDGAGWETLFVAIDDHARIAFTAMHPDERKGQAVRFLCKSVAYYAGLGITIKRLLTDNGGGVLLARVCSCLRGFGNPAQVHAGLPTPDQWQGRAIHPIGAARVGLWLELPELG